MADVPPAAKRARADVAVVNVEVDPFDDLDMDALDGPIRRLMETTRTQRQTQQMEERQQRGAEEVRDVNERIRARDIDPRFPTSVTIVAEDNLAVDAQRDRMFAPTDEPQMDDKERKKLTTRVEELGRQLRTKEGAMSIMKYQLEKARNEKHVVQSLLYDEKEAGRRWREEARARLQQEKTKFDDQITALEQERFAEEFAVAANRSSSATVAAHGNPALNTSTASITSPTTVAEGRRQRRADNANAEATGFLTTNSFYSSNDGRRRSRPSILSTSRVVLEPHNENTVEGEEEEMDTGSDESRKESRGGGLVQPQYERPPEVLKMNMECQTDEVIAQTVDGTTTPSCKMSNFPHTMRRTLNALADTFMDSVMVGDGQRWPPRVSHAESISRRQEWMASVDDRWQAMLARRRDAVADFPEGEMEHMQEMCRRMLLREEERRTAIPEQEMLPSSTRIDQHYSRHKRTHLQVNTTVVAA